MAALLTFVSQNARMADSRKKLGDFGEQVASTHLQRHGLSPVAQKWRCPAGEIDLVMQEGSTLVFVEVRTRKGLNALESVGQYKQARLVRLAYTYLEANAVPDSVAWRIDVVAITVEGRQVRDIEWIRSAVGEG